jgi:hypothetical protein
VEEHEVDGTVSVPDLHRVLGADEAGSHLCSSSKGSPWLPQQLSRRSESGVKAATRRGAKRRSTARRGTREALTLRPSGDDRAPTSVFWMESSRERRHYIRSVGLYPRRALFPFYGPGERRGQHSGQCSLQRRPGRAPAQRNYVDQLC